MLLPNKYQEAIYNTVTGSNKNIVVRATAGSGKTTTLVGCSKILPSTDKNLFLAFNKSIVAELKGRLPAEVECSTIHGKGVSSLYSYYGACKLDDLKSLTFSEKYIKGIQGFDNKEKFVIQLRIDELLKFTRMSLVEDYSMENMFLISDHFGLSTDSLVVELAIKTFKDMDAYNKKKHSKAFLMDFTDMVYIPATNENVKVKKYDNVMVDECQDLNKSDIKLIERLSSGNRTIFVGDPNQMIYLFAGADSNAYDSLTKRPNTVELPLSVSYRCSKRIVEAAQKIVPEMEALPTAPDGLCRTGMDTEILNGDMVLCRNTAPLIGLCFDLLKRGIKANVVGKEFEKSLKSFCQKNSNFTLEKLLDKAYDELLKTEDELRKRGVVNVNKNPRFEKISERNVVLDILSKNSQNTRELVSNVESIFCETKDSTKLMTIHRSKGLESKRVFFYKPGLLPSKFASTTEELRQEKNLEFVAITRAKEELIYLH